MAEAGAIPSFGGYDDEFVNAVEDDLQCGICQLPLKEAVQTGKCGHRFCRQCLDDLFRRSELNRQPLRCPMDRNKLIRDKDIFSDKATERKILSFIIRCPSKGCQWTGELRAKDIHLATCPLKVVSCSNENCHAILTRNTLQEHVTVTCPWRILCCSHCNKSHPQCKTGVHKADCKRLPLNCPKSCGAIIPREEVSTHTEKDCPLTIISCPYAQLGCTTKIQQRELENHCQTAVRLHLDLACVKLSDAQVRLSETEVQLNNTQVQLTNTQVDLTNTQVQLTNTQEEFKAMIGKLEEKYNVVEKMWQCSEEHNYFKWKISDFTEVLRKAKSGEEENVIYSDPFYRYGYKCRLHLLPNGLGSRKNTHLTIGINIMKGEHDDALPWPFHKKLTFTLIDQQKDVNDRKNIGWSFIVDPEDPEQKPCFVKPVTDKNPGYGCPTFVSHSVLRERRGYIVDDIIIIIFKCKSLPTKAETEL